jgi:ribosomal protein L11 methyltransferase
VTEARFTVTFGALSHADALGFADTLDIDLRVDALALSVNETDESNGVWEAVAYFESEAECIHLVSLYPDQSAVIGQVVQENWVEKSLQGLPPVKAGRFFLYGSHDASLRRAGGISLEVNAGTAFGTGHHATTTGGLLAMDQILKRSRPQRIFDLGCGTGVLAIAAQKVSRTMALATDIDPEAVRVTKANSARNQVAPAIVSFAANGLHHPAIAVSAPYDLILANILARPLERLATGLSRILNKGGSLVLSGITTDQMRWIKACYRNTGLVHARTITIGNWATLVFRRGA